MADGITNNNQPAPNSCWTGKFWGSGSKQRLSSKFHRP